MIATVTLNASIDKAYHMEKPIENGQVMRVNKVRNTAGGKGLNVARVARLCGADVLTTGYIGGYNGSLLESLLDEDHISHQFHRVNGETRSCINILDPKYSSTEYLEPGFEITAKDQEDFLESTYTDILDKANVITLSGSAPRGADEDLYAKLVGKAKESGKKVLLDTSGIQLKNAIEAGPTMIKPNREELEALSGEILKTTEDVIAAARKLSKGKVDCTVISMGKDGALYIKSDKVLHSIPPKITPVNTVGCGDSMVGAFAAAFEKGMDDELALRYATAVATANSLNPSTGNFDPAVLKDIYENTRVETL